jgi:DNA replication protein DnaC
MQRANIWGQFVRQRGKRYQDCRLETFECSSPKQTTALKAVATYAADCVRNLANGNGLLLFGPCGTGKDHLIAGALHRAICCGAMTNVRKSVQFRSGADLFGQLRDGIAAGRKESDVVSPLVAAGLLILSDVCQSGTSLTDFQQQVLYRVIDRRYLHRRPVWLTANVGSRSQLESMLGVAIVDRVREGSTMVPCDWPSFRKTCNVA